MPRDGSQQGEAPKRSWGPWNQEQHRAFSLSELSILGPVETSTMAAMGTATYLSRFVIHVAVATFIVTQAFLAFAAGRAEAVDRGRLAEVGAGQDN